MLIVQTPNSAPATPVHATGKHKAALVIESNFSAVKRLGPFVSSLRHDWHISESTCERIRVCLEEAALNAITHGNKMQFGKNVHIYAWEGDDHFTFMIQDEGEGFSCCDVGDPTRPENLLASGGRGIFIMKHLADSLHYSSKGTSLQLFFYK